MKPFSLEILRSKNHPQIEIEIEAGFISLVREDGKAVFYEEGRMKGAVVKELIRKLGWEATITALIEGRVWEPLYKQGYRAARKERRAYIRN